MPLVTKDGPGEWGGLLIPYLVLTGCRPCLELTTDSGFEAGFPQVLCFLSTAAPCV